MEASFLPANAFAMHAPRYAATAFSIARPRFGAVRRRCPGRRAGALVAALAGALAGLGAGLGLGVLGPAAGTSAVVDTARGQGMARAAGLPVAAMSAPVANVLAPIDVDPPGTRSPADPP